MLKPLSTHRYVVKRIFRRVSMSELALMQGPMYPMTDIEQMATVMVKSRMFGFKNLEEAVSLMLMAQAEGKHPAVAAQEYHVIQGRPALKADAMLARFQAAGGVVVWEELDDKRVVAHFSHPKACPKPVRVEWTMERAKTARLTGKDNWQKYPRQMLKARVLSEGVRMTFPGVTVGMYTEEEVESFDNVPAVSSNPASPSNAASKSEVIAASIVESKKSEEMVQIVPAVDTGNDVQHVTKDDAVDPAPVEKTRGKPADIMERLKKASTVRGTRGIVTRAYKNHTFTQSERNDIEKAAEWKVSQLQSIEDGTPHEEGNEF